MAVKLLVIAAVEGGPMRPVRTEKKSIEMQPTESKNHHSKTINPNFPLTQNEYCEENYNVNHF